MQMISRLLNYPTPVYIYRAPCPSDTGGTCDRIPDESVCSNYETFPFVQTAYALLALMLGFFMSFNSRHLPGAYSEAQWICVAMVFSPVAAAAGARRAPLTAAARAPPPAAAGRCSF